MNYNHIVQSFTQAVALTTGKALPTEQKLMCITARRFLADNIMSEMHEYATGTVEVDKLDALADAAIYITDSCIRFGIQPMINEPKTAAERGTEIAVFSLVLNFLQAKTLDTQTQTLSFILTRLNKATQHNLLPFIEAVAECNKQKINSDGTVTLNERGKVLKPADFKEYDLNEILSQLYMS